MSRLHHQTAPPVAAARYAPDSDPGVDVAIVTAHAGGAAEWEALLRSLRGQSLQHWSWRIVVEDGRQVAELESLTGHDPRISVEAAGAGGLAASRNAAIEAAATPYVCLLDSRSLVEPTFLEKCAWVLGANETIACCNARALGGSGQRRAEGFEQGSRFFDEDFAGPTFLIRRDAYLAAGGFDAALPPGLDLWDFWLRLAQSGQWGYTIPETLVRFPGAEGIAPPVAGEHLQAFRARLRSRYGALRGRFPQARLEAARPYERLIDDAPIANSLGKPEGVRRLLIIMPWLIVGGAERVNLDIIRYLSQAGYEITFATTLPDIDHNWIGEFAGHTPDIFVLDRFLRLPDVPRFLAYLVTSRKVDVVMISNSFLGYQLLPYLRARCPGVVFLDYCHSEEETWKNGGYPRLGAAYQELLDLNITSSEYVKRWMVARGAQPERIEVCYTNVDVERWRPDAQLRRSIRASLGLDDDTALILFVGRLSAEKRPAMLAHILRQVQDSGRRFLCLVLGDGPERTALEQAVRSERLGVAVRVLGRVGDEELRARLAAADILLLPSLVEGISVAVLEAMAMGIVPVSARVGGQPEVVTAECGVLVSHGPDELEEYVRALQLLIDAPERRRAMGEAARERVERHFPLTALGPRMAELFDRACLLSRTEPRPAVGLGLARESATQAIELTRVEGALHELWMEREGWRAAPRPHPTLATPRLSRRRRAALFIWSSAAPIYRWAVGRGFTWLVPLKDRARQWARRRI